MLRNLAIAAISALMVAGFTQSASGASIGAGNPYPVSNYTCEDGTRLAVRLLGDRASVSVNDAAEVDLPAMGGGRNDLFERQVDADHCAGAPVMGRRPSCAVRLRRRLSIASRRREN